MRIPIITGPTAVGKTSLAAHIAVSFGCEIVSADSRQVFRELEIGTAKPGADLLTQVPHHFVSERSILEPYSAGAFARDAEQRISGILSRGRLPLVTGGSTLYLSALQHGLAPIPEVPAHVRQKIRTEVERTGSRAALERLRSVDPLSAAMLDPTKTHRLIRALEVFEATGKPLSHFHGQRSSPAFEYHVIVLTRVRPELYARIDARTDAMLEAGLVDEVRGLLARGFDANLAALQTIGYREVIGHLRGEYGHEEMRQLLKRNTRRYAKRQLTWFRRFADYEHMMLPQPPEAIIRKLAVHGALPTDRHDDTSPTISE